jgi:lycopene cyclase domain-containing protein
MPIEEWLFFFIIPFCSLFIHFAINDSFPKLAYGRKTTLYIAIVLIVVSFVVLCANYSKAYTAVNFTFLLFTLSMGLLYHIKLLQQFFLTFLVILIPFIVVNGILTGTLTDSPVVWYDDSQNLGLRLGTIPIEDFGYAFSMLFGNLMIFETLRGKRK